MYMPVPVYSEIQAVRNHAADLAALGKKALIVTGKHSARSCGALEDVLWVLEAFRIPYVIFDEIEENPAVSTVMKAAAFAGGERVDFVIGIGGGSPLDAAKAIAYLLAHPGACAEALYTPGDDAALPLVLVPTTCGTGSEVTPYSVLTRTELQTKKSIAHRIFARLALIDGSYLKSASLSLLRNTALDALSHLIESYLNTRADDFSRMFVQGGLSLWAKNREVLENGRATDRQRQEMMNCSAMAGMAITETSTGIPHGLSYCLTVLLQVPHGKAVGYFLAGYLNEAASDDRDYLLQALGFSDLRAFQEWYLRLYGECRAEDAMLERAAAELAGNPSKTATAPFDTDQEVLRRIAFFTKQAAFPEAREKPLPVIV